MDEKESQSAGSPVVSAIVVLVRAVLRCACELCLEHEAVLKKLKEAHELVEKEKADVKAMHDNEHPTIDAEDAADPDRTTFANPLTIDTDVDSGEE